MEKQQMAELIKAIGSIAHGDVHGPGGLEGLAMALAGNNLNKPLSEAVCDGCGDIANAIRSLAEFVDGLAKVLDHD